MLNKKQTGFTIVELLIVIVVIGILAAITIVAYNGIQQRARKASLTSDLKNTATKFEVSKADTGSYPATMTSDMKASTGNILQATNTGNADTYCINGYTTDNSLLMSWNSTLGGLTTGLCPGATIGTSTGGTAPAAPRGVNLVADFSQWTLAGSAAYNSSTGILTLGASGTAKSPLVRVDQPTTINTGGDFYATTASPNTSLQPNGGFHDNISYFASDGTTAVTNVNNYTANGCAQSLTLSTWIVGDKRCTYNGGPNVIYVRVTFSGSNAGYASPDLQLKNPLIIAN